MQKPLLVGTVATILLVVIAYGVPSPGAQQVQPRPDPGSRVQVAVRTGDGERPIDGVLEHFDRDWLAVRLTPPQAPVPPAKAVDPAGVTQVFWIPIHAVNFIRVFEENE